MRPDWHQYFMIKAKISSIRSTCNSRPAGCVIVRDKQILSTGFNGAMSGDAHCTDQEDINGEPFCFHRSLNLKGDGKYDFCKSVHAEANAVAMAARAGISLKGATIYTTLSPCYTCFKQLVGAGVERIFYEYKLVGGNKRRDIMWDDAISTSPMIKEYAQITVPPDILMKAIDALQPETSRRRLKSTS